jgi:hypothetical protein
MSPAGMGILMVLVLVSIEARSQSAISCRDSMTSVVPFRTMPIASARVCNHQHSARNIGILSGLLRARQGGGPGCLLLGWVS